VCLKLSGSILPNANIAQFRDVLVSSCTSTLQSSNLTKRKFVLTPLILFRAGRKYD
jgi:hypothetical protein